MKNLPQQLAELDKLRNPHRLGALFEPFVAQILEEEGYSVSRNPKTAQPRQTDLVAIREEQTFLIEAKWLRKKQWHVLGTPKVKYELRFAEACWVENIPVLHIACDWKEGRKITGSTNGYHRSLKARGPAFPQ